MIQGQITSHKKNQDEALHYISHMLEKQCGEQLRKADSDLSAEEIISVYYDRLCLELARERLAS